jgi:hypothetical protein
VHDKIKKLFYTSEKWHFISAEDLRIFAGFYKARKSLFHKFPVEISPNGSKICSIKFP